MAPEALRTVQVLNTVIGKMSGVIGEPEVIRELSLAPMTPGASKAILVEEFNRILLVVHGLEDPVHVTLPEHEGVAGYSLLWDSAHDDISELDSEHTPGTALEVGPTSMLLFRAHD